MACFYGSIEIIQYLLASGREVNILAKGINGKSGIDIIKEREKDRIKKESEGEIIFAIRKNTNIIELLESYQRNPNGTSIKLRIQLGFSGFLLFSFFFKKKFNLSLIPLFS